jgi:hypothetical protein
VEEGKEDEHCHRRVPEQERQVHEHLHPEVEPILCNCDASLLNWLLGSIRSLMPLNGPPFPVQNLADPDTWNSSALQTLKQLHDKLL